MRRRSVQERRFPSPRFDGWIVFVMPSSRLIRAQHSADSIRLSSYRRQLRHEMGPMDQTAQYLHAIYHDLANVLRQSAA
jgi:hypothetical protein